MGNIFDYLLWRGDVLIDSSNSFNEIDSLILSIFSFLPFNKIDFKEATVFELFGKMEDLPINDYVNSKDKELLILLKNTNRFKDLVLSNYERIYDKDSLNQFCAITIHLPNNEIYISFIGTDSTIHGWNEDLNMSFMETIKSQIKGKEYLEKIADIYKNKKIRIGGFSKGGNVSIYSYLMTDINIQNKVIKVDNFDGPGFSEEFVDNNEYGSLLLKIETYIPQESIIGRLLNHNEKITIINSNEKHIYQHDIFTWNILGKNFIYKETTTKFSDDIKNTITKSLENTSIEQRKVAINAIFDILYSLDVDTFKEISTSLSKTIPKILNKYRKLSKENRKNISNIITIFIKSYINNSN